MFDSATLNRAAHVIRLVSPRLPADAALRQELAANRALSATARRAVSRVVFSYYRWLGWLDLKESLQRQLDDAIQRQMRFEKNPASVKPEAIAARALPSWLADEVALPAESLRLIQQEPVLWLRARPGTAPALARALGECAPASSVSGNADALVSLPDGLRYNGPRDLYLTDAFRNGRFEIQDLASQAVGALCAPQPGQTWWDTCAGEGGKTLHLADLMANKGVVWASDRSVRRLEQLKRRFSRAQLFNVRVEPWDGTATLPTKTKFDGILVDAPCSGVGTWQRNPHARWTTSATDVRELAAVQFNLLHHAAGSLKSGGRLIYSVCTVTRSETSAVVSALSAAHPELKPLALRPGGPVEGEMIWPHTLQANGMFIAAWQRE